MILHALYDACYDEDGLNGFISVLTTSSRREDMLILVIVVVLVLEGNQRRRSGRVRLTSAAASLHRSAVEDRGEGGGIARVIMRGKGANHGRRGKTLNHPLIHHDLILKAKTGASRVAG